MILHSARSDITNACLIVLLRCVFTTWSIINAEQFETLA